MLGDMIVLLYKIKDIKRFSGPFHRRANALGQKKIYFIKKGEQCDQSTAALSSTRMH